MDTVSAFSRIGSRKLDNSSIINPLSNLSVGDIVISDLDSELPLAGLQKRITTIVWYMIGNMHNDLSNNVKF